MFRMIQSSLNLKRWVYGIRALARVLITYQDKYNIRTIKGGMNVKCANHGKRHGKLLHGCSSSCKTHENKILTILKT